MTGLQQFRTAGIEARQLEYEDRTVLAADFGTGEAVLDVVDGTAIVVTGDDQYEFDIEEGAEAVMNNGVLTIEVSP